MFCDPIIAFVPSTTRSLRWLRRSIRRALPRQGMNGSMRCHSMPAALRRLPSRWNPGYFREPMWSKRTRTSPPRSAALEGAEEDIGRIVPGHDVDLDMHVLPRLIDELGHARDARLVVR